MKMSKDGIIIRRAKKNDFLDFQKMESKAWKGSGIPIISKDIFNTWLKVYPEGFWVATVNGVLSAHIYFQICYFDPFDENDNRNFNSITDHGYSTNTHDINGNCLYVVSVSSIHPGAARKIINNTILLTDQMLKEYYAGTCRMAGLKSYAKKHGIKKLTKKIVSDYAQAVADTIKRTGTKKVHDPVLSSLLKVNGAEYARVVKNFLPDKQSDNWASVIYYKNKNYK